MISAIISTEYNSQHKDWNIPEEWADFAEYIDDLDTGISPSGDFDRHVEKVLSDMEPGAHANLTLPVDDQSDLSIHIKAT